MLNFELTFLQILMANYMQHRHPACGMISCDWQTQDDINQQQ